MPSKAELRDGIDYVSAVLHDIHTRSADEALDEARQAEWDAGVEYVERAKADLAAIEKREDEARAFAAATPKAQEPTHDPSLRDKAVNVNTRTSNPFDISDRSLSDADIRARALDVIEKHVPSDLPDAVREGATRTAERRSTKHYDAELVNRSIIETTSPEYVRSFQAYARNPQAGFPGYDQFRASMSLTAANGGYLVPQFLDDTIVLTNDGVLSDVRRIAGQTSITVDQWDGVTSAGVTAEWLSEGSEAADASPTFVAPTITPEKMAAYVEGTMEFIADSNFAEVGPLMADAFARLEGAAFINGTGSNQPYGLITQLSGTGPVVAGSSGDAGAADLVAADIYALVNNLPARFRRNASWLAGTTTYNEIRQLGTADTYHAFWADLGPDVPAQLLGRGVYYADDMDETIVSGSNDYVLIFGDFREGYKIVDRVGTSISYVQTVIGANQRPVGKSAWFATRRVGADVITSSAFKVLKL